MQHAVTYLGTLPRYYLALPAPPAPPRKGLGGLEGRILQRSTVWIRTTTRTVLVEIVAVPGPHFHP